MCVCWTCKGQHPQVQPDIILPCQAMIRFSLPYLYAWSAQAFHTSNFTRRQTLAKQAPGIGQVNSLDKLPVNERADSLTKKPIIGHKYQAYRQFRVST